ncbi:MAG: RnfABCDGE type electron transport complex subunit G [Clostridia bacterium]|nr:RnfABCDGE type electron transport complex subunit G [Clostridia bacterium]
MNRTIFKHTLALVLIALVAALGLAVIYQLTKDTIAKAEADERMQSFREVCPDADRFDPIPGEELTAFNQAHPGAEILEGYRTFDREGNESGVVLSVVSHEGYGGDIVLSVGINKDGTVSGVMVTSMSETSGLGANCQDKDWAAQFKGKKEGPLGYVKNGNPGPGEIDAITGATLTTKAVLEAVNQGLAYALQALEARG